MCIKNKVIRLEEKVEVHIKDYNILYKDYNALNGSYKKKELREKSSMN